jgi:hypothetical protein
VIGHGEQATYVRPRLLDRNSVVAVLGWSCWYCRRLAPLVYWQGISDILGLCHLDYFYDRALTLAQDASARVLTAARAIGAIMRSHDEQ